MPNVADPDMAQALAERDQAIEHRADVLAEQAIDRNEPWVRRLGTPPAEPALRTAWIHQARVVAAYRERWGIGGMLPVDDREHAGSIEELGHQQRAQAAVERALVIARQARQDQQPAGQQASIEAWIGVERTRGVEL